MGHIDVSAVEYSLSDGRVLLNDVSFRVGDGAKVALRLIFAKSRSARGFGCIGRGKFSFTGDSSGVYGVQRHHSATD